jgi:hypothetical protein
MNSIVIFSCRRSGHHAIIKWLGHHLPHKALRLNDVRDPDVGSRKVVELSLSGVRRRRIPEEGPQFKWAGPNDVSRLSRVLAPFFVANWEDFWLDKVPWQHFGARPGRKITRLYVVRDIYNVVASTLKKPKMPVQPEIAERWLDNLRIVLTESPDDFIVVNYNKWCLQEDYRKKLAAKLRLTGHARPAAMCNPGVSTFVPSNHSALDQSFSSHWKLCSEELRETGLLKLPGLAEMCKWLFPFDENVMEAVEYFSK